MDEQCEQDLWKIGKKLTQKFSRVCGGWEDYSGVWKVHEEFWMIHGGLTEGCPCEID